MMNRHEIGWVDDVGCGGQLTDFWETPRPAHCTCCSNNSYRLGVLLLNSLT